MKRKILRLSQAQMVHQREICRVRDEYRCRRCGGLGPIQVHHIVKRSQGGGDELTNLQSLCVPCHKAAHPERRLWWTRNGTTGLALVKRSRGS